ncbi:MAG: hypothetical protein WCX32_01115 [Clostridia bacterium]|jgi:ankyrin repeat protein|nr:hypothetical protein [Clostridia bacterium]
MQTNNFKLPKTKEEVLSLMDTIEGNRKKIGNYKAKKLGLEILGLMREIQPKSILATEKANELFDLVFTPDDAGEERINQCGKEVETYFNDVVEADINLARFDSISNEIYIKLLSGANLNVAIKNNGVLIYPLRLALASNLFELFLIGGANPNSYDKCTGEYIIMEACSLGLSSEVDLLCIFGADTNVHNNNNEYPIHRVTENFEFDADGGILRILLENKANPNAQDIDGTSALHNITDSKDDNTSCIELMHKYGANLNITNYINQVPLTNCAYYDKINQVKCLIDLQADPSIVDTAECVPGDYATDRKVISLLRDYEEQWIYIKPRTVEIKDSEQICER